MKTESGKFAGMTLPRRLKPRGGRKSDPKLRDALVAALRDRRGEALVDVTQIRRRPCGFGSSYQLEELDVDLADGTTLGLIWKDVSPRARLEEARRVKPRFLYDPTREICVYRHALASLDVGTAAFHGAVIDARRRRYWLFLENVRGRHLWQFGEFDIWLDVARWLARMHVRSAYLAADEVATRNARVLRYDVPFYERWARRARRYVTQSSAFSAEQVAAVRRLTESYGGVAMRLASLPATLIHGEFYPSNVLIAGDAGDYRVRPVDWEMAALGPGCVDLAALTAGKWSESQRDALVAAYHDSLCREAGPSGVARAELNDGLAYSRLHLAMQWLGWSRRWSPPREHVQDWVAQAVSAGERIGL